MRSQGGRDVREEDLGHCKALDLVSDHIDTSIIGGIELEDMFTVRWTV
jgi:hypothetical protein